MEASREAGVVRVTIDHFSMTAQEMSRLWADQDTYIDLLESRLEKGSQREQRMMSELVKKRQQLHEMTAQWEKLKASRVRELGLSEGGWVCNNCYCRALRKKDICQIPSCTAGNKSPENIKRVCTSCFINVTKSFPESGSRKKAVKKTKKKRLYSILKPRKTLPILTDNDCTKVCPSVDQSETDTATETEAEQGGRQDTKVSTKRPCVDQSDTETEEEQSGSKDSVVDTKTPCVDQSETDTASDTEEEQGERQDTKVSTKQRLVSFQSKEIAKTAQKIVIKSDPGKSYSLATSGKEVSASLNRTMQCVPGQQEVEETISQINSLSQPIHSASFSQSGRPYGELQSQLSQADNEVSTIPNTIAPKYVNRRQQQRSVVPQALKNITTKERSRSPLKTRSLSTQTGTPGLKYSEEEMKLGALLMYSSRKTYDALRALSGERYPCPRTIQTYVQRFRCFYGINEEMFFLLSQKLQTLSEIDRNVTIIFDEIDLQPKTDFSQHLKKRIPSAKKAMVVMVRGLRKSFKEVVYYDFDRQMDMDLLGKIIVQVEKAGGAVRAVTLDMGNKKLLKEFKVNIITRVLSIPVFYLLGFPRSLLLLPPEQS